MRYSKAALLVFGAGALMGLAVVAAEVHSLERLAAAIMALGIVALPIGFLLDWRSGAKPSRPVARARAGRKPVRRSASRRRKSPR